VTVYQPRFIAIGDHARISFLLYEPSKQHCKVKKKREGIKVMLPFFESIQSLISPLVSRLIQVPWNLEYALILPMCHLLHQ